MNLDLKANYTCIEQNCISSAGILYPFVGLRGDAKQLYLKIKSGEITNVKLKETSTILNINDYYKESDIVTIFL